MHPSLLMIAALSLATATSSGCTSSHDRTITRYDRVGRGAYAIVAEVHAKPGKEDELRAATLPLVANVRHEPDNQLYFLHEDREAPGRFVFYEIFATKAAFDAHNSSPHVQAWFARLNDLADGGVKVSRLTILGNGS
jgi:quinol monooxygenase YgiN